MEIVVQKGSILEVQSDGIVNAANSQGVMGGGVAGVIRRAAGKEVEEEAVAQAPIPVGSAVLTGAGRTQFRGIIHAPTMPLPAQRIPAENVYKATGAALQLAEEKAFHSVALPGMGTGVGGVAHQEAARQMMKAIGEFSGKTVQKVILVDVDPSMVAAWKEALEESDSTTDPRVHRKYRGEGETK